MECDTPAQYDTTDTKAAPWTEAGPWTGPCSWTSAALVAAAGPFVRRAGQVHLVELATGCGNAPCRTVVVEHLPARAGIAAARRPGRLPDTAAVVHLIECVAVGDDVH